MIHKTNLAWKRRGHPHAQIHLPPLTAEEALLLCNLLDRAICALWRTHGDAMGDLLACLDPEAAMQAGPADSPCPATTPPLSDNEIF
jgi:hypothetical protein